MARKRRTLAQKMMGRKPQGIKADSPRGDLLNGKLYDMGAAITKLTDLRLSEVFAECFRDSLVYVPEMRGWMAFDGKSWIRDGANEIAEQSAKEFVRHLCEYIITLEDDDERMKALTAANRYQAYKARANLLKDAQSDMVEHISAFDATPYLFNVDNGTLDLSQHPVVLREHRASDLITKCAPVRYVGDGAPCQIFMDTLSTAMEGDIELMEYLQKTFALALMGVNKYEKIHLFGEGTRSGKGTIMHAMMALFGMGTTGYASASQPETFAVRRNVNASAPTGDRARLKGVRLLSTSEPPESMEFNASFLKELSGQDPITASFKYSDDFNFVFNGQLIISCNTYPSISDASLFASDRIRVVPFEHHIPESQRDTELKRKISEPDELSGILAWLLEGVHMVTTEGYNAPEAVREATAAYAQRHDTVSAFVMECLRPSPGNLLRGGDVYARYSLWCETVGRAPLGRQTFYQRIRQRGAWLDRGTVNGEQTRGIVRGYVMDIA